MLLSRILLTLQLLSLLLLPLLLLLLLLLLLILWLDRNLLKYINSYLDNGKQCVHINNIYSVFNDIISGVPQGSVVGTILLAFFHDFFFFIKHATVHNFADDNTLLSFAKTFDKLKEIL